MEELYVYGRNIRAPAGLLFAIDLDVLLEIISNFFEISTYKVWLFFNIISFKIYTLIFTLYYWFHSFIPLLVNYAVQT